MSDALNKKVIIYSALLGVLCMSVMIYYGMHKELAPMPEVRAQAKEQPQPVLDGDFQDIYQEENTDQPLTIALPPGYDALQAEVTEDAAHRCVQVFLQNVERGYFTEFPLTGSAEDVRDIVCRYDDEGALLLIYLKKVCACQEQAGDASLMLDFVKLREKYERLVVLDAGHGGVDDGLVFGTAKEKELTMDIVGRAQGMLEEKGIHVLLTRTGDESVLDAGRLELANQSDADLFLSVHCAKDEKDTSESGITTYYNDTYFIPGFGNTDLAYEVEDYLLRETKAKAHELQPGQQFSDLLKYATIPTAYVEVGYLSNEAERQLLLEESYRESIARGLCDAVMRAYELLEE